MGSISLPAPALRMVRYGGKLAYGAVSTLFMPRTLFATESANEKNTLIFQTARTPTKMISRALGGAPTTNTVFTKVEGLKKSTFQPAGPSAAALCAIFVTQQLRFQSTDWAILPPREAGQDRHVRLDYEEHM